MTDQAPFQTITGREAYLNQTPAAVLAIVTVPARAGTCANASRMLVRQAAEADVRWQIKNCLVLHA